TRYPGQARSDPVATRHPAQRPALEQMLLPALTRRVPLGRAAGRALVLQHALEDVDRRVERSAGRAVLLLAVPSAIGHLLAEQPLDDASHLLAGVRADPHDPSVDARLDIARAHWGAVRVPLGVPRRGAATERDWV